MGSVREYVKLVRPYGILFLGFTPVFGALCNGQFNVFPLFILLCIGLLAHGFTFVQNDYYDIEVDRRSKYVVSRPLTTGMITKSQAFFIVLFSFSASIILAAIFLFTPRSFTLLLLSFFFMTLYNKYSKRAPAMEYVLGFGVFTYGLFGAFSAADAIAPLAIIISSVGFLQWVFSVGISANLKDVEFDTKLGIRTTPVVLGVTVVHNTLKKPLIFSIYAYGIKAIHLIIAFLPFLLGYTSIAISGFQLPLLLSLFISMIVILTTFGILHTPLQKRDSMLRYEGAQEGFSLLLIPCVLLSYLVVHIGVIPTIVIFLLLALWPIFILWVLYGRKLIPLE